MHQFSPFAHAAIDVARAAGTMLLDLQSRPFEINFKSGRDLVTSGDRAAEELIVGELRRRFPDHGFLAEEKVREEGPEYRWIIDPVDGTTNFAHLMPWWGVALALEHRREIVAGVIDFPATGELFVAERGKGAWIAGGPASASPGSGSGPGAGEAWRRLRVSQTDLLKNAVMATGLPYDVWETGRNVAHLASFCRRARSVRITGSASLHLAYVAAGRMDGFWEPTLSPWDIAPGALMVMEAGGTVTKSDGTPHDHLHGDVLATNGRIHAEAVEVLQIGER